ncbi:signal peptidase I [Marinilabilia sp.]|uniref:signal peptidase I n=1 Tax=Marinilabilia sp. TaxID=2021252 RepID=UPI0025BCB8F2|nr:signal peptidase I [Marinilabilia sp.]
MIRLIYTILLSGLIISAALWFHIVWIPLAVLILLWLKWYFRKKYARIRNRYILKHPKIYQGLSAVIILGIGLGIGLLIYRFGIELISVPSASMEKAINPGDYIVVNKLVPGPRRFPENPDQYFRMAGTATLQRGDIILFNFPEGDTILENRPDESYYYLKRHYNNFDRLRRIRKWGNLVPLEVKNRPRFVKRVAGLPGDTIQISTGILMVNNKEANLPATIIRKYRWNSSEEAFMNAKKKTRFLTHYQQTGKIIVEMTKETYQQLPEDIKQHLNPALLERNVPDIHTFPFNKSTGWNTDYMGPVKIPAKGNSVILTTNNIDIYKRAITVYEGNTVTQKNNKIFINGKPTDSYTFKMNYYWVMGDNRPKSFDSRFWGLLPENHIIGKIPEKFIHLGK